MTDHETEFWIDRDSDMDDSQGMLIEAMVHAKPGVMKSAHVAVNRLVESYLAADSDDGTMFVMSLMAFILHAKQQDQRLARLCIEELETLIATVWVGVGANPTEGLLRMQDFVIKAKEDIPEWLGEDQR